MQQDVEGGSDVPSGSGAGKINDEAERRRPPFELLDLQDKDSAIPHRFVLKLISNSKPSKEEEFLAAQKKAHATAYQPPKA